MDRGPARGRVRRAGPLAAAVPAPAGTGTVELAAGLKMENPARTGAQVRRILAAQRGWAPSVRTIQRWLEARELTTRPGGEPPEAFGRFEAARVNEIWTADLMNGPKVAGRPSFLAGIIDDRCRFLAGARFIRRPDAVRFAGVLRAAIAAHGIPRILYTDNGSCFADSSLARTCAVLGIKLTHSAPGRPMGRGKVERVFETIQQQFLAEVTGDDAHPARQPVKDLEELNGLLGAWVRKVYHARVHSETGQAPQARLAAAGPPSLPDPALLKEAFCWSVIRLVRKTGTVDLEGNVYSVDPFLVGRKVECDFDPFDMTELTVYWRAARSAAPSRRSSAGTPTPRRRQMRTPPGRPDRHRLPEAGRRRRPRRPRRAAQPRRPRRHRRPGAPARAAPATSRRNSERRGPARRPARLPAI